MRIQVMNVSATGHNKHHTFPTANKSSNTFSDYQRWPSWIFVPQKMNNT